jgi:hypothetical protein
MKVSNLRIKAVWTLRDSPGGMYSLGILLPGLFKFQLTLNALAAQYPNSINHNQDQLFFLILRCVPHTLIDDSYSIQTTLNITPRCVPHILTGNVQSTSFRCLRKNKVMQTCVNLQKSTHVQLPRHAKLFTPNCKTDHSGFPRV